MKPLKPAVRRTLIAGAKRVLRWDLPAASEVFHTVWYDARQWQQLRWFGVPMAKNPFDVLEYQDVISDQRPDYIIECGALHGGSTLYFAHLCDLLGHGHVISIDVEPRWAPPVRRHPRVTTLTGSSTSEAVVAAVHDMVPAGTACFVILDSDHSKGHVLDELRAYRTFVQVGNYLVVEDSNVNGHPVRSDHGPGPWEAVEEFLAEDTNFEPDLEREAKLGFTWAPRGWLRRVRVNP